MNINVGYTNRLLSNLQNPLIAILHNNSMNELKEIKMVFEGLHTLFETHLSKIDPHLVHDLLKRNRGNPTEHPFYLVEIFTKSGTNSENMKEYFLQKTGMLPSIYDKGTHYAINTRLTMEFLKELSNSEHVIHVAGDYMGTVTGTGASHENPEDDNQH